MPAATATTEQVVEATVTGPDEANRLFNIVGTASVGLTVTGGLEKTEVWTFLVGPQLTRRQFHRAIATASIGSEFLQAQAQAIELRYAINSVEADWDDESGRVEVRVEVFLTANASTTLTISQLRYSVTVLAQM